MAKGEPFPSPGATISSLSMGGAHAMNSCDRERELFKSFLHGSEPLLRVASGWMGPAIPPKHIRSLR